jgi:phage protein D/phage baseplate assembly protein gpV
VSERFFVPRFEVRISGVTMAANVTNQVISLTYESNLDIADMFALTLRADARMLDSALFNLGKQVEIHMGYGDALEPMMLGEITALEPSFPEGGAPTLRIVGYDKSYRMRHNTPDRPAFKWVSDSIIAAQIAVENGLIPIVDPSPIIHRKPIRSTGSDMALLIERARANFFEVFVHWDKLYFRLPRPQTSIPVLERGRNLSSFAPRISSASMAGLQVIRGYNQELAQQIVAFAMVAELDLDNILEQLGSAGLSLLTSMGRRVYYGGKIETPIDAMVLAQSLLKELLEGLYEGSGSCIGLPELRAGQFIRIEGVGKRFSGTYRLRKVTHSIGDQGYETSFEVTQRASSTVLSAIRRYTDPTQTTPPDRQKKFEGVVLATVSAVGEIQGTPPDLPLGRVKLHFPWLSDTYESDWAPVATPMAGSGAGMYFVPSPGDQVLVAFQHGDFSNPVVLGSLWNVTALPPEKNLDGQNRKRVIKSKAGHTITLDDTLDIGKVVIEHKLGSSITLDADGSITLSSATTLTLKAKGAITLDAPIVNVV